MSFADEMRSAKSMALESMTAARNAAVTAVADSIIDDTPVLTGALKGSWRASTGAPDYDITPRIDPSGETPKEELRNALGDLDTTVFLTNALPYSEVIEYDGHSAKAPEGMVRKNLAKWQDLPALLESSRT